VISSTCPLRSLHLGRWPKVKTSLFSFLIALHLLSHLAEDHSFKDKDVKTAEGILKEQEDKPDHVDYEFQVYKGKFLFGYEGTSCSIAHRDSSRFRLSAKFGGS
jgi:hypothetical protein